MRERERERDFVCDGSVPLFHFWDFFGGEKKLHEEKTNENE